MSLSSNLGALSLVLTTALGAFPARAALGETEASIARDRRALSAAGMATTPQAAYTVHELTSSGLTVREYVSADGVVFAVTWGGMGQPDLSLLLGPYADEYRLAAERTPKVKGQHARRIAGAHLVVERWGHMRDLHGRAYLPDLVPQGVTIDEIR
ncbi:MAG TPA: DUF2844 domain-containing protein [Anaeromyxobacter sp.]|nr:DUF2844 domain-containing protein [Anaeromyxobacter sp.]